MRYLQTAGKALPLILALLFAFAIDGRAQDCTECEKRLQVVVERGLATAKELDEARKLIEGLKKESEVSAYLVETLQKVISVQGEIITLMQSNITDYQGIIEADKKIRDSYKELVKSADDTIAALKKKTGKAGVILRCGGGAAGGAAIGATFGGPVGGAVGALAGCIVGVIK